MVGCLQMSTINLAFSVHMHCSPLRGGVCSSTPLKLSWLVTSLTKRDTMFYLLPLRGLEASVSFFGGSGICFGKRQLLVRNLIPTSIMLWKSPSHVERLHRLENIQSGSVYVYQEVFRQFQIQPPSDSNFLENLVESIGLIEP